MQQGNRTRSACYRLALLAWTSLLSPTVIHCLASPAPKGEDGSRASRVSLDVHSSVVVPSVSGALPNVAIVASASGDVGSPWFTDPRDRLVASGRFSAVSIINAGQVTPSLLELTTYDAILVWSNFAFENAVTLGDNLAAYVDGGGGVVIASFANSSATSDRFLGGEWLARQYDIIPSQGGTTTGTQGLGTIHLPMHPLVAGITSFLGGSNSFRPSNASVIDSASVVAEWADGSTLIAVREDTIGSRVDLGFYPPSDGVLASFWDSTTDGGIILANALAYAAARPPLIPGDSDADQDIDADDFSNFEMCVTGANNGPPSAGCMTFDVDADGDVDCDDWTVIETLWTGPPAIPPLVDCNSNGVQDACDVAEGVSSDCSGNGIPDECEPDCNLTGVADSCDILAGTSDDCNANGVPDECDPPLPDCNGNGVADGCDIAGGTGNDCNNNGIPDSCDVTNGTSQDLDGDGIPDECCAISRTPQPVLILPTSSGTDVARTQNRYLSFLAGDPGQRQAIRVTFALLPPPFDTLNDRRMWVGPPREVSELPGVTDATPPTTKLAALQCAPYYTDWSVEGIVHAYHWAIVPDALYRVQVLREICPSQLENFYSLPFSISTSAFGDSVGRFDNPTQFWTAPNDVVGVPTDIVATVDKFRGLPTAPSKARVDISPEAPDQVITITDITMGLDAFRGTPFPFLPQAVPCLP